MKLNQFEQAVLYALACLISTTHPHVNLFLMLCVSNGEITGNVKEGIRRQWDYLHTTQKGGMIPQTKQCLETPTPQMPLSTC